MKQEVIAICEKCRKRITLYLSRSGHQYEAWCPRCTTFNRKRSYEKEEEVKDEN